MLTITQVEETLESLLFEKRRDIEEADYHLLEQIVLRTKRGDVKLDNESIEEQI